MIKMAYLLFWLFLIIMTIKSVFITHVESCPDIMRVPEDGFFYRCLSEGEPERMKAYEKMIDHRLEKR